MADCFYASKLITIFGIYNLIITKNVIKDIIINYMDASIDTILIALGLTLLAGMATSA